MQISGNQIRAARALMKWDRSELAERAGLHIMAVQFVENETKRPRPETLEKIESAFRDVGVIFIENEGVKKRPLDIEVFEGLERFQNFIDFMLDYLEESGGEICISISDERVLQHSIYNIESYRAKMLDLSKRKKITGRILATEGNFKRTWADLRRQPKTPDMPNVSFYAFGDNLALISLDHRPSPYVVLHKAGPFGMAYKVAFNAAWDKAEVIDG